MKNYNISTQKKSIQAYKKEYLNYLKNAIDSLYTYLHYYNPQWRLLEDNSGYYTKINPNLWINKTSLESYDAPKWLYFTVDEGNYILISKIEIKRSDTDILTIYFKQGGNYTEYISNIAHLASIPSTNYVLFEVNDFQYISGSFSLNISYEDANEVIIYTPTGAQIQENFSSAWKTYYISNRFNIRFSSIDKKSYTINPNNTYPYSYDLPDDEQPAWFQQFSYTLQRPILDTLLIEKLQYRWGYKNTSDHVFWYGPNYTSSLNIGATIYKKDPYDVSSPLNSSDLNHYILFEASLAQYVTWTLSTGVDENNNAALIYNCHISNELDFGLVYNIQTITSTPRYFYKEDNNTTYDIKYEDSVFDTMTLFDYININVQYKNNEQWIPSHSGTDYQYWSGATELFPQTVYENSNQYEDLIADTELYERPGNISTYQVRLEKSKDDQKNVEKSFKVIFS